MENEKKTYPVYDPDLIWGTWEERMQVKELPKITLNVPAFSAHQAELLASAIWPNRDPNTPFYQLLLRAQALCQSANLSN